MKYVEIPLWLFIVMLAGFTVGIIAIVYLWARNRNIRDDMERYTDSIRSARAIIRALTVQLDGIRNRLTDVTDTSGSISEAVGKLGKLIQAGNDYNASR